MRFRPLQIFFLTVIVISVSVLSSALPVGATSVLNSSQEHSSLKGMPIPPSGTFQIAPSLHVSTVTASQVQSSRSKQDSPRDPLPRSVKDSPPLSVLPIGAASITPSTSNSSPNTVSNQSFKGMSEPDQAPTKIYVSNTGCCEPPDASASVGPSNVVQTVNTEFTIYSRTGSQQFRETFGKALNYSDRLADPRVVFDPIGKRFIMLIQTYSGDKIFVLVAQQTDAQGKYCTYTFPTISANYWSADQPKLGVDNNGIYLSATLYQIGSQNPAISNELFEASRTQMESCQSISGPSWTGLKTPEGVVAVSIVPAIIYSSASSEYLVASYPKGGSSLTLWKLAGSSLTTYHINTLSYSVGPAGGDLLPSAPQKGTSTKLKLDDCRIYQASYLNGLLDVALTGAYTWSTGGTVTVVWWFKIDPNASPPKVVQQNGLGSPGNWYYYPAIQQDSNGNAIIVYAVSSGSIYPSANYVGLTASGNLETAKPLISGTNYFIDANGANPSRWGDFQSAVLDPTNSTHIWITGMDGSNSNPLFLGTYWETSIGEVGA